MVQEHYSMEEIVAACAARDQAAFRDLYDRTAGRLMAVAMAILHRRDWAEEALQDAYVNVWRHAASYDPARGTAMTWLMAIVRYRALSLRERLAREGRWQADDDAAAVPDPAPSPFEAAVRANAAEALRLCLEDLDDNQRTAVQLAFVRGYTHMELAEVLGHPLGTVKSWVRRGLMRLRECLANEAA